MTAPKTIPEQIAEFETAAKQCGVSVHQVCVAARINHKVWLYWKSGFSTPPADVWRAARAVIADLIEASDPGPTEMQVP